MTRYRISKYNPKYRYDDWVVVEDTWTSFSDIGSVYNGNVLSIDNYLEVEEKYILIINKILDHFDIDSLNIKEMETYLTIDEIKKMLLLKKIYISNIEINFIKKLKNNAELNREELNQAIKFILRECFWAILEKEIKIEFGYDYYVYILCNTIPEKIIEDALNIGIYIEKL